LLVVLLGRFPRCGRGLRRQIIISTAIAGVAVADVRSSFQVRHGELMTTSLTAIPMSGAGLWLWQVDVLSVSSPVASSVQIGAAASSGEVRCYSQFLLFSFVYFSCCPGSFSKKGFVMYPQVQYNSFLDHKKRHQ
jgi:hypothetical protein